MTRIKNIVFVIVSCMLVYSCLNYDLDTLVLTNIDQNPIDTITGNDPGDTLRIYGDSDNVQYPFTIHTTDDRSKIHNSVKNTPFNDIDINEIQNADYTFLNLEPRIGLVFFIRGMSSDPYAGDSPDYTGWAKFEVTGISDSGMEFNYAYYENNKWTYYENQVLRILFTGGNEYLNVENGSYSGTNNRLEESELELLPK